MHVCAQDLCITEASNPSNILSPKVQRLNLTFVPALTDLLLISIMQQHHFVYISFHLQLTRFMWFSNRCQ